MTTFNTPDGFDHGGNLFVADSPKNVSFSIGVEATNAIPITITLTDGKNDALANRAGVDFYLSDAADGLDITANVASGGLAVGTDQSIEETTAAIAGKLYSDALGVIVLTITEVSTDTWYVNVVDAHGRVSTSDAVTFA